MRPEETAARRLLRRGRRLLTGGLLISLFSITALSAVRTDERAVEKPVENASLASSYLCSDYNPCRKAGYSDAGYGANNDRMYWRMYSGHNCTNYAAYRMIKAGMPNERPWDSSGMAYNWGYAMRDITDQTPTVGAIAWWDRYEGGIGSSGHVAYVEKVVSDTKIIISEDSWSGTFHWREITKSSGRWPSGFIHFIDVKAFANTAKPSIAGTPAVGSTLTAQTGSWTPSPQSFGYQWFADGVKIAGATQKTFVPTVDQLRTVLTVQVTAKRTDYTAKSVRSAATTAVTRGTFAVQAPPSISGEPMADTELTAVPGTWSPEPASVAYRWIMGGTVVGTGPTFQLTREMVGKSVTMVASARREGFRRSPVRTEPFGPVLIGQIEMVEKPTVSGPSRVGGTLQVTPGSVRPSDATVSYQWVRAGAPIAGATGTSYTLTPADFGSRVWVVATYDRASYAPRSAAAGTGEVTTTQSEVGVRTVGLSGRAVIKVQVTAPGAETVAGRVLVEIAGRTYRPQLVDGRVRLVVRDLERGNHRVDVTYGGTWLIAGDTSTGWVWVTR